MNAVGLEPAAGAVALARHHLAQSRPDRALKALEHVAPEGGEYWLLRATALHDLERYEEAARAASEGLKSWSSTTLLLVLGSAWTELNRLADAERAILSALADDPQDAVSLTSYALTLAAGGQVEKASAVAAEAVRHDPGNLRALTTHAYMLWITLQDRAAEQVLRNVLAEAPEDEGALGLLAGMEAEQGQHDKSYARIRRMLGRNPARIGDFKKDLPEAEAAADRLLTPVRPFMTPTGPAALWLVMSGLVIVTLVAGALWLTLVVVGLYIVYAIYSHVVFAWLRRRARRRLL
jgi:tetratricopeptide (TPR) repeat protein